MDASKIEELQHALDCAQKFVRLLRKDVFYDNEDAILQNRIELAKAIKAVNKLAKEIDLDFRRDAQEVPLTP